MPTLTIIRRDGAYWLEGYLDGPIGPYEFKKDADETRRRLLKFERFEDRKGYVTCERS